MNMYATRATKQITMSRIIEEVRKRVWLTPLSTLANKQCLLERSYIHSHSARSSCLIRSFSFLSKKKSCIQRVSCDFSSLQKPPLALQAKFAASKEAACDKRIWLLAWFVRASSPLFFTRVCLAVNYKADLIPTPCHERRKKIGWDFFFTFDLMIVTRFFVSFFKPW